MSSYTASCHEPALKCHTSLLPTCHRPDLRHLATFNYREAQKRGPAASAGGRGKTGQHGLIITYNKTTLEDVNRTFYFKEELPLKLLSSWFTNKVWFIKNLKMSLLAFYSHKYSMCKVYISSKPNTVIYLFLSPNPASVPVHGGEHFTFLAFTAQVSQYSSTPKSTAKMFC